MALVGGAAGRPEALRPRAPIRPRARRIAGPHQSFTGVVLEGIEPGQASSDPSALAHRYVREGILAEQKRWSDPHDTEFDVLLPADHHTCGDPSTIVAHGAGLAVLREQVYRQLWPSPTDLVEGLSGFQTPYDVRKGVVMADHHVLGL